MIFITKNVAVAALLVAPVIAAPLSQAPEDLERRARGEMTQLVVQGAVGLGVVGAAKCIDKCVKEARKKWKRDYYDGELGLEARGAKTNVFESREWDGELEERGIKTNIAAGAVGGYFIGKLWHKFRHRNDNKDAPKDAPVEARDLVDYVFESREWDGELEERGVKTNIAAGAVGGYFIGKLWHKFRHGNDNKDAPNDAPVEARDLVDFIYARAVLNRARALERRNALENMIDELD